MIGILAPVVSTNNRDNHGRMIDNARKVVPNEPSTLVSEASNICHSASVAPAENNDKRRRLLLPAGISLAESTQRLVPIDRKKRQNFSSAGADQDCPGS